MLKVIEVLCDSKVSWEDAAKKAVDQSSKTLHNIRSIYIKDHSAKVHEGKITEYRINAQITFTLDDK